MSLRSNIVANYVGQSYATVISIVMVPIYLHYMGAEAYGLVGFFVLMQSWFQLLDLGLSPTLGREAARFRGGSLSADQIWRVFRAMEGLFAVISVAAMIAVAALADTIASRWLAPQRIPVDVVATSVALMGASVALRGLCGIYRSVIWGFERQVWLNTFTVAISTLRFGTVVPVFIFVGTDPVTFFSYQLIVSLVEFGVLVAGAYGAMPQIARSIGWSFAPLREVASFSLTIAFTAGVWVLVTQTDKLVLSKVLSLEAFGYFSLGVLVAGAVHLLGLPVVQAVLPRLAKLAAEGDDAPMLALYRDSTQWVSAIAASVALGLACFAEAILWTWTGDRDTALIVAPVLGLYALGNGLLLVASFQYHLQYAKGDLRLHLIGNVIFVVTLVPLIAWAASKYGAVGAGIVWVGQCAAYLFIWTAVVHHRFIPGDHWRWFTGDVLPAWLAAAAFCLVVREMVAPEQATRSVALIELLVIGPALLISALATSSSLRVMVRGALGPRLHAER